MVVKKKRVSGSGKPRLETLVCMLQPATIQAVVKGVTKVTRYF